MKGEGEYRIPCVGTIVGKEGRRGREGVVMRVEANGVFERRKKGTYVRVKNGSEGKG